MGEPELRTSPVGSLNQAAVWSPLGWLLPFVLCFAVVGLSLGLVLYVHRVALAEPSDRLLPGLLPAVLALLVFVAEATILGFVMPRGWSASRRLAGCAGVAVGGATFLLAATYLATSCRPSGAGGDCSGFGFDVLSSLLLPAATAAAFFFLPAGLIRAVARRRSSGSSLHPPDPQEPDPYAHLQKGD
jgi:hypothetical protein